LWQECPALKKGAEVLIPKGAARGVASFFMLERQEVKVNFRNDLLLLLLLRLSSGGGVGYLMRKNVAEGKLSSAEERATA
jgi:hypothetical protein